MSQPKKGPAVVAVTGGAGFIGSNLLLKLVPRFPAIRFICIDALTYAGDRTRLDPIQEAVNFRFVHENVSAPASLRTLLRDEEVDTVIHLAAESHVDRSINEPAPFIATNLVGTFHLLEIARDLHADGQLRQFLHMSTDEVYGPGDAGTRMDAGFPYRPRSPYAATKAGSDHLVNAYSATYGLPASIVHSSNCYGPRQLPEKLIPKAIGSLLAQRAVPLYGDGMHERNWLFVDDLCEGLAAIVQSNAPLSRYVLSTDRLTPNRALVETIAAVLSEVTGVAVVPGIESVADRPGHDRRYTLIDQSSWPTIGWKPTTDLKAGLRQTIEWYVARPERLQLPPSAMEPGL